MKLKIIVFALCLMIISLKGYSQWPGYFYGFELIDKSGKNIDSLNQNYMMKTIRCSECKEIILSIKICDDNKTWRFYGGGNHELETTNMLEINKLTEGKISESMTLVFPAPYTGGEHKYYANLYVGKIKFKKGTYKIGLPETSAEWDALKELKLCQLPYMDVTFLDIRDYQK
jgi:hypothetical protein